ncbi:MAG TPA: MFS transporter [Thermoplasmata archaeon]|nr:MFS transporter [Thermoplasmata archaeon]
MRGGAVEPPVSPEQVPAGGRRILHALDTARLQRFHFRTILIAGMGFFTDAYDLFVISLVIPILASLTTGGLSLAEKGLLGAVALLGAMAGQVLFGFLGDRLGRKRVYAITLSVMAIAAVGSAFSRPFAGLTTVQVLMLWRFLLGVGVGGDYPLSATIMSEYSNIQSRGRLVATVFAMQGFGLLTGAAATLGVVFAIPNLDVAWRVILGLGAVPALLTIYFRARMPETPRYSLLVQGRADEAAAAVHQLTGAAVSNAGRLARTRVPLGKLVRMYGGLIVGTALSWLLLDVAFYSTNIFNPTVLTGIGFGTVGETGVALVRTLALGNVLIAVLFTVPGYWAAVALIDRVGRRPLQYIGFGVMAASFLVLSFEYTALRGMIPVFLFIYGTTFFFANFGPNTTTFVYPTEVFPTSFRTTGHGFAAAAGKLGAVIGVFYFPVLVASGPNGLSLVFEVLAMVSFLGLLVTIALLPETSQRSLEDSSGEDELAVMVRRFSTYLRSLSLTVGQGATALAELLAAPGEDQERKVANLRALEHRADEEVHRIFIELNNRRLSPDVRTDVGHLASALDDIMDGIEAVGARVRTYRIDASRPELVKFARIVVDCVDQVAIGILGLDDLYRGSTSRLQRVIIDVNRLENEADDLLRVLLEELFERSDPIEILKWKDFYERLEVITDRCEDVTDVFQDLEVRYAPSP